MPEKVVVTGMGAICAIGNSVDEMWNNAISGISGVGPITLFDASELDVRIACEVKGFNPVDYMSYRDARRRDRVQQLTTVAANEAITQSKLNSERINKERVGVVVSSAIGGMRSLEENMLVMIEEGTRKISPFVITKLMINGTAALIAIDNGYKGPCFSVVSACSTGTDNIGIAWTLLRAGIVDIAITGSAEAPINKIGIASFDRLGAVSRDNDDYSSTPKPFDKNRNGLVIGEAAAILVLERESHANQRDVNILAEVLGYAATEDAYHITAPSEDGEGGARAIINAMESASISVMDIDYINAHGTATILNDLSETNAIKKALGDYAKDVPISSTKSMTGHTMGAAGALEAIICVKAIIQNTIPPTINYHTPDPSCDLDYVPNQSRELPISIAISNSFGFGGHNAVLVLGNHE